MMAKINGRTISGVTNIVVIIIQSRIIVTATIWDVEITAASPDACNVTSLLVDIPIPVHILGIGTESMTIIVPI